MEEILEIRRQVKVTERKLLWAAGITLALLAAAFAAGQSIAPPYYWSALSALPFAAAAGWINFRFIRLKALLKLRERWQNKVEKDRDFEEIASLHEYLQAGDGPGDAVDGQTWHPPSASSTNCSRAPTTLNGWPLPW